MNMTSLTPYLLPYLSPAVLAVGVIIGWVFALRAQAREKILGARDRTRSLFEMLLEEGLEEVEDFGTEFYFRRPRFAAWKKSRWDSTAVVWNAQTKKAEVSFSSPQPRTEGMQSMKFSPPFHPNWP